MFDTPNPKSPGRGSRFYNFVRSLSAGNDISVSDLGSGIWQVAYVPKAPSLLSIQQDYNDYGTGSPNQIAAYSHGKNSTDDQDSYIYTLLGFGDTIGQTIEVQIDFQACGTFTTTAIGGFEIQMNVLVRSIGSNDCDVYTRFSGCGLSEVQPFTSLGGNQISLDYSGGKVIDPYFTAGGGSVSLTGFNAIYKPKGSV